MVMEDDAERDKGGVGVMRGNEEERGWAPLL